MNRLTRAAVAAVIGMTGVAAQGPRDEIDRVAAFARLYGVVRYFYPSDAAASLDWNRVAVYGVAQAQAARNATELSTALSRLFAALGPGILIGTTLPPPPAPGRDDPALIGWRYLGAAVVPSTGMSPYVAKRTHRPAAIAATIDGFVTMLQTVPVAPLRGKVIRLRGLVRARIGGALGSAALWVRVDRADGKAGFFDNMGDRPVQNPDWGEYRLEGPVADDATGVTFGAMASGAVSADFDRVVFEVQEPDGTWVDVPVGDAGFENADSGAWKRAGSSKTAVVARPTEAAPEGRQYLRVSPAALPSGIASGELFEAPLVTGAHADVDLGSGLRARVPLTLSEAEAAAPVAGFDGLRAAIATSASTAAMNDVATRLADVAVAWNVFRHFYPYWTEAGVDWDARLRPQLELAHGATTRQAHVDALRRLVADVRDGHGAVADNAMPAARALLPIRLGIVGEAIVVTASDVPSLVPVGAVVSAIDGIAAKDRLTAAAQLASGSTQWREVRGLQDMTSCSRGAAVKIVADIGSGARPATLTCEAARPPLEQRPAPLSELRSGAWYVDLTRIVNAQLLPSVDRLAVATGIVFDLRGYPTESGAAILPHLIDVLEQDRWMHIAKIAGPYGQSAGWTSIGWNLMPRAPRLKGRIVFLTDGRAISYAESVMGYVKDRSLGTIIGSPTAGANGNVVVFPVPGGLSIAFTGMRVTGHDGRAPHHLIGVRPDVPMSSTLDGIRAGRDELLEAAIRLIERR